MKKIIKGLSVYYEIHGDGYPLLLIAGLGSDSASWSSIIPGLSSCFQVIIFDNCGCGRTSVPAGEYSIGDMANDAVNLLNALNIKQTHVLGHSMGGYIAQTMAIKYPERVSKLILASTAAVSSERNNQLFADFSKQLDNNIDYETWIKNWLPWLFSGKTRQNNDFINEFVKGAVAYDYRQTSDGFRGQIRAIKAFDGRRTAQNIKIPTLIIAGSDDQLITPQEAKTLAKEIKGSVYRQLEEAGHSIFVENCTACIDAIKNFLA